MHGYDIHKALFQNCYIHSNPRVGSIRPYIVKMYEIFENLLHYFYIYLNWTEKLNAWWLWCLWIIYQICEVQTLGSRARALGWGQYMYSHIVKMYQIYSSLHPQLWEINWIQDNDVHDLISTESGTKVVGRGQFGHIVKILENVILYIHSREFSHRIFPFHIHIFSA